MAAVWRGVLGVDRVGVHDSFFDLGGDSIRAVALVGALREKLLDVSVGDVLAHRTVGELSGLLAGRAGLTTADEPVEPFALISDEDRAKLPDGLADAYPMSQVQTGMVVEMLGGGDTYRSFISYRISDSRAFSEEALREAARRVVGRHEMLRTSFDLHSCSLPMQLVHAAVDVPVTVHRVPTTAAGADGAPGAELMSLLGAERDAEFDLSRAPLLRVAAYAGPDAEAGWWLSLARPHATTEGWSHNWLLTELMGVYGRLRDGLEPEPYDTPAVRYADYIAAELAALRSKDDAAYWRNVVDTHTPFTLPDGWGREEGPGESYDLRVPLDDIEGSLRDLATELRVSVKSVLLAAHVKVMSQLTESPAFQVGLVCDARPELTGADRVYGMHLNTVPFPADRSARTWRELVTQVFDREAELWPHRRYPFPAMQRDWHGGRLVDVAFNYVDLPQLDAAGAEPGGASGDVRADARFGVSQTEFDITVHCRGDRLNLTTNTAVLSRADGERLCGMYRSVLEAMAADADGDARATHLPGDERRLLLDELTATGRTPVTLRVPDEVRRRAAAAPDATAVVTGSSVTTYQELDARSNRLAHRLRELGVGPGVVVGICLERSPELVLSVLAVLKAGGAYLPLDPETPAERLDFMLHDAAVRMVLTRRGPADAVPMDDAIVTVLLDDEQAWSRHPSTGLEPVAADDDLAYVIYTSGSTGRPKGAMVHRGGMGNHLLAKIEDLGLGPADGVVFNAPPAFDISVWQMLAALVTGGRVRIVDGDTALDPSALFGCVADEGITVLEVVPSLLRTSLDFWDAGAPAPELPCLRRLVVTGEALPAELCDRWLDRYPDIPLVNAYGPTECSDDVTHAFVPDRPGEGRVPIGEAVRNTRLYALDAWLQPVPVGAAGELYVGGAGVGRGYLHRPALTAERFLPDPFGPPGARLYRTGDLAAWRADRALDFLGRVDDQVKIRGHRVELREIEEAFGTHPGVRQAVVVVRDERLVGYFTALDEQPLPPDELRERLARTLPDYMLPTAFVRLAAVPLTPNGKVDKRALPAPGDESFVRGEYVAPRTENERRVAEIWRDTLGVERVGVRDGFFDLGGDSIRAVALVGALRAEGVDIAVRDVLEARTVERLCGLIAERDGLEPADQVFTERFALITDEDRAELPEGVTDAYPVGRTQIGMLIEMMDSERSAYHIINTFRVADDKPLDPDALRRAAAVLAARHEVLRTSFRLTGYSAPLQLVHATAEIPVQVHDVRGLSEDELVAVRSELVAQQRAEPFTIERAPLFRIVAHDEGDDAWWVTFTQSHAITEGWSYHQLLVELLDCYRAVRDGAEPEPYDLPRVRFADAIAAELESLRSPDDRAYWRRITSGYVPVTVPPEWAGGTDDPLYNEVPFDDLAGRLRELAASAGVSLKSVLMAAHMKVMGQLTDEPAYHSGLVVDTRPEALGADRVLGMYLNTLPFAMDRSARTWRELVTQVFDREVELWAHRRCPMPVVQHEWGGGRLINTYFNYIDFRQVDTGKVATGTRMTSATNEFDFTVFNRGDRLYVNTRDSFMNADHARRVAGMYRTVLEAMAADHDGDAQAVYLPEGERERPLGRTAALAAAPLVPEASGDCVHELFERQAARTPDAVAVVAGDVSLSYAEVDARANRLAHRLRALGAGPEKLVGVCLPRGADLIPTLLGVLKSGAAYLPLDPANPADRLAYILKDAGASVLVTDSASLALVEDAHEGPLVVLDRDRETLGAEPTTAPAPEVSPDNAIYVMYTSGSTGRPKGVTLAHRNVVRLMGTAQEHYAYDEADVWAMFHSYAFDVSVFELWGALLHGGTLVVVDQDATRSPDVFLDLLVEREVTVLCQTPSAFRSLLAPAADGDPRVERLSLRAVIFAGERLETADLRPWAKRLSLGRVALANMYGITETTVHTTYHRITRQDLDADTGNPIGRPLSDLDVHLLDPNGHPVPEGTAGEIHVGGPGVARGYLNRPDLTAERFVPDPFGPPGARLYRSGDLARRRPDGSLDFLGRIDHQVKIRGYRVELGEIETTLAAHPGVREAVVTAREDTPGEKRLIAYLVPDGDTLPGPAELRTHLSRSLPDYMVPAAYQDIERIPLTANGKLDKGALPAPDEDAFARASYVAPRTPVEERVAGIWRDALGRDRVGVHDGFFQLGGDSLNALVIASRMAAAGVTVTARDVLKHQTIDALCAGPAGGTAAPAPSAVAPFALLTEADRALLPEGVADAYPLTQAQKGMLVEMLAGDGPLNYHRVSSVRIGAAEPFSREPLQRALRELVTRQDALRTGVDTESYSVPLQLVHTTAEVPLRVVDLTTASPDERDRALRELVEEESGTPLPHGTAPLLRLVIHRFPGGDWQLTVVQSHLIMDGWTFGLFRAELLDLYRTFRDGRAVAPYEPPAVRFADTVDAEQRALASAEDRAYWSGIVDGHARFALPTGWGDPDGPDDRYRTRVPLDDLLTGLRAVAADAGASLKSVLLAAHLKVLSQLTPERRFFTGLVTHCRPEAPGADRVYGSHLNPLPFPVDLSAATWHDLVRQVRDREIEAWPHRHFPMHAIQHELGDGGPLIDVRFSYHDFAAAGAGVAAPAASGDIGGFSRIEVPLGVSTVEGGLQLNADSAFLGRDGVERLAAMYRSVLESIAAGGDGDTRTVFLPPGERDELTGPGAAAPGDPVEPVSWTAPLAWREQVARTPDAVALSTGDTTTSYAELDVSANRIAHRLRAAGVRAESVVGVLLERGTGLMATLLGVWKAGGAYLPLDPSVPAGRLRDMLADAGADLLVTVSDLVEPVAFDGEHILLDRDREAVAALPGTAPEQFTDPDTLAYVICTSGSTGRPKGVQVTHRGLANYLRWALHAYLAGGGGGAPLFSSVAFDLVVPSLWAPLLAGQPVRLLPEDADLDTLGQRLLDGGPYGFVKLTPGHLEILGQQIAPERLAEVTDVVVVAGEALPAEQARTWARALGEGRLLNSYGPTETTVASSGCAVDTVIPALREGGTVPVGRAVPGARLLVLGRGLEPVPRGTTGELYIGGTGVARGYAGRPGLTADRFVPDPYGVPGGRLYRTGDLARTLPDGNVEFLGRTDDQIKIRGHRVEPGEIERVLVTHPEVSEARVLLRKGASHGAERLVAYVTAAPGGAPDPEDLRDRAGESLPPYMVPTVFVTLERMPLTANGKLDRAALPDPDDQGPGRAPVVSPRTPVERTLAAIWAETLQVEQVGVHDRFFALGGHSIVVFQMIAAARRAGLQISLLTVYQDDSLEAVAAAAEALPESRPVPAAARTPEVARPVASGAAASPLHGVDGVPGASIAVIRGGELVSVEAHGVLTAGGTDPVTPGTVFQVGSLSKHITAFGVLRLVEQRVVDLDEDVNAYLRNWRVPDGFRITLRQLLGHLSGLAPTPVVHLPRGQRTPSLTDLLHGRGPGVSAPARPELEPGQVFRKANVHYSVVQQVLEDATGRAFADLMDEVVLKPLGLTDSSFDPAFPEQPDRPVALGHDPDGRPLDGGWLTRTETAAAGLWTTAADLAKAALEIRRARLARPLALLTSGSAQEMLTAQHPHSSYGLGTVVDDLGPDIQFGHGGGGAGYHAMAMCRLGPGHGFVVLTNGESGAEVARRHTSLLEQDGSGDTSR
ncbi:amino acid adenylation domain-containing protein [Streptomyces sp. NPDC048295]|uniref:amino acid adenylation domain-containing protein n=1 Tax=Streptomyces sp. NPDC048295 TaxID=3154617 RepID=UPI0034359A4B